MTLRYFESIDLSPSITGLIVAQLDDDELVHRFPPRCFAAISPIKQLDTIPEFDPAELERMLDQVKDEPMTPDDAAAPATTPQAPLRPRAFDLAEFPLDNKENLLPLFDDPPSPTETIEWESDDDESNDESNDESDDDGCPHCKRRRLTASDELELRYALMKHL
jgi:hypothetical protein